MQDREMVVDRKRFWGNQKRKMLAKSDGRCCHCGKGISERTMTVEHVIPISKGGTNDLSNTVALCKDCNKKKRNFLTFPDFYYKYLKDEYRQELMVALDEYIKKYDWLSLKSYFKLDSYQMVGLTHKRKVSKKVLVQVQDSDIPRFYKFCDAYAKRVGGLKEPKYTKEAIEDFVKQYAIYGIKSYGSYSSVIAIRPFELGYGRIGLSVELLPAYKDQEGILYETARFLLETLQERGKFYLSLVAPVGLFPKEGIYKIDDRSYLRVRNTTKGYVVATGMIYGGDNTDILKEKFSYLYEVGNPEYHRSKFTSFIFRVLCSLNPLKIKISTDYTLKGLIEKDLNSLQTDTLLRAMVRGYIKCGFAWFILTTIIGFFVRVPLSLLVIIYITLALLCTLRASRFVRESSWYSQG